MMASRRVLWQPEHRAVTGDNVSRSLAGFVGSGYDKGRPRIVQALSGLRCQNLLFFKVVVTCGSASQAVELFGARIGRNVLIRHRVRVRWPWKLRSGRQLLDRRGRVDPQPEPVSIGHDISQGAFLCTGGHDISSPTFEYDNGPITLGDGVWVGASLH